MVNFIGKLFQLTGEAWSLQLVNNQSKNISEVLDQKEKGSDLSCLKNYLTGPRSLSLPWLPGVHLLLLLAAIALLLLE